jgi:sugar lactone lactonase YvrE
MKISDVGRCVISGCAAVGLLAGCAGSQPPVGMPNASTLMAANRSLGESSTAADPSTKLRVKDKQDYKVLGTMLYVVNQNVHYSDVTIYDPKADDPSPLAVITKGLFEPGGVCIDGDGTLYVTNDPGSGLGWVSEYALGKTEPLRVITEGINLPGLCAIDSHGNLWVPNLGGPTVTEYLKGSVKPHTVLKDGLTDPNGVAIDHAGRIYVGNLEPYGTSNVQVFPPGGKSPSRTITDGVTWPGGIAVDAHGTLYVPNAFNPCNIEEYRAGESEPYRTLTRDLSAPFGVTFAKDGWMYEVNAGNEACNGPYAVILEFPPGSAKPSRRMISKDLHSPSDVAYYPPLLP